MSMSWMKRLSRLIHRENCPHCGHAVHETYCDVCGYELIRQTRDESLRRRLG